MITIPSVLEFKDITVFPDDENCNLYYCIRSTPRIRTENGTPVFNGMFWTDDATGKIESTAGIAGGEVKLDVNLGISDSERAELEEKIKNSDIQKKRYNQLAAAETEKQNLRNRALPLEEQKAVDLSKLIQVSEKVSFGSILFKEGTMDVLEEESGQLVTSTSSGGACSGFGDNNAVARISLSSRGGAVWYKALKGDNLAVGVRYNLKFQVRVPSLEIRAYAGSYQYDEIDKTITVETKDSERVFLWWYKKKKVDKITLTKTLIDNNAIVVDIKKGSAEISNEYIEKIRESIVQILANKIEAMVTNTVKGMTEDQRNSTKLDLDIDDILKSFTELRYTQEDVMDWTLSPQATITELFEGVEQEKKDKLIRLHDLSEKEAGTSIFDVNVAAPWDQAPNVVAVQVDLVCPDANNKKGETQSFIFTKGTPAQEWSFRTPKNGSAEVEYTATATFLGRSGKYVVNGKAQGAVFVNIPLVGIMDITFKPHPQIVNLTGKKSVTAIEIALDYESKDKKHIINESLVLYPNKEDGFNFKKDIGAEIDQPVKYTETYLFKDGSRMKMNKKEYHLTEDGVSSIYTEFPFKDSLDINVDLPFIPGDSANKVRVEFLYEDKLNNFEYTDYYAVSKDDDWEMPVVHIPIINKNANTYKYRFIMYTADSLLTSEWTQKSGDAESIVLPISQNRLLTTLIGIGQTYIQGILKVTSQDGSYNKEIILTEETAKKPLEWYTINKGQTMTYSYQLTLFDAEGNVIESEGNWDKATFYIPKPNNPKADAAPDRPVQIIANLLGIGSDFLHGVLKLSSPDKSFEKEIILDANNTQNPIEVIIPGELGSMQLDYHVCLYTIAGKQLDMNGISDMSLLVLPKPEIEIESDTEIQAEKQNCIMANLLGIGTDYFQGELIISMADGTHADDIILDEESAKQKIYWTVPSAATTKNYIYTVVLYDMEGNSVEFSGSSDRTLLVLPKPKKTTKSE